MVAKRKGSKNTKSILKDEKDSIEIYKLYINRHMKEGDWIWVRFQLYLSLNVGAVALIGILLKEFLTQLPFDVPIWLWFFNSVVFLIGAYLARAWKKVCEDGARWQFVIDRHIAEIESAIFKNGEGLYSTIVKEWKLSQEKEDVVDISSKVANFFFGLWISGFVLSTIFFIISLSISLLKFFMVI
jgi:hypothetical protein